MRFDQVPGPTIGQSTCKCGRIHIFASQVTCPDCSRWGTEKVCKTCAWKKRAQELKKRDAKFMKCIVFLNSREWHPDLVCPYWEDGTLTKEGVDYE